MNEIPNLLSLECPHSDTKSNKNLFPNPCVICGQTLTFADDSSVTFSIEKNDGPLISQKLDLLLEKLKYFLAIHCLKLNCDKTELIRITSRQQLAWNRGENILLTTKNSKDEQISPNNCAKILGITISNNLTWGQHLHKGKGAILNKCKKKLGALKHVASTASIKNRKRLADGCVMSIITYGIQIWGVGAPKTELKKVQTVQNLTASWVCNVPKWTKTKELLDKVGWLSINQLVYYHSALTMWKVFKYNEPKNNMKNINHRSLHKGRIDLTRRTWSQRTLDFYNSLPMDVKNEPKISLFKSKIKKWIKMNIPIHEEELDV